MAKKKAKKANKPAGELTVRDLYPEEEQGIVLKETEEELLADIRVGKHEVDPLTPEGRESLVEDDEMEPWEAGFAEGASDEGQLGKDALTGEPLMDIDEVVEAEIEGKTYRFVSEKNARKFRLKHNSN
ncbi:MAG TPA: hypothetical protein VJH68_01955 [Candidatus Nanoarchaeia archaeon]|nr:hypothetical protein [Candidatus Nanoarchaeia archaeon]